ncbi:MAG TPA: DUF1501 domain-containing protein [Planctomycetes bacterium]|nr:DUF1501 domain-containing protein [Planctomycetota bacterium]
MPPTQPTRRELLRAGGSSLLGLSLADALRAQAWSAPLNGGPGWGRAKGVILIFLQGGPSHLDLWDPKDDVPDSVRSPFKTISSKVPGMEVTELLPRVAEVTDRLTFIRTMSYSPIGLFNHTAAHYQMLTGYTADKVSPSGQLDPPSPKDFPNLGSNIARLKPPERAMLPFVMMPRPLQESNVIGKAGNAGFLGRAHDPYTLYPAGDDFNETKMDRIQAAALSLRPELSVKRLGRRADLRNQISAASPHLQKAIADMSLDEYFEQALGLILSGRARDAFDLSMEPDALRDRYGRTTFGQSCLMARRFIEAGTRFVQVNWPKQANSDRHSWDVHKDLNKRMKNDAAPRFDPGFATLIEDMDERGLLEDNLVVAVGEFGRSPKKGLSTSGNDNDPDGRDHWPYCFTAAVAGAGIKRGHVHGESDATGSAPLRDPVHPTDLLATIYHALGIDPHMMVLNHLLQPRELVTGEPVTDLFVR